MILFANHAALHLARYIPVKLGDYVSKRFSDGELFVRVNEEVQGKKVWVIASTQPPADNLLELFFLLDALHSSGASINILITYFSYVRQIVAKQGEAHSAQVICKMFNTFTFSKILVIHPHSLLLHDYLSCKAIYDLQFFCNLAHDFDAIAAPDVGASAFAKEVATLCNKDLIILTKTRPDHEQVKIVSIDGPVTDKKILLVDDIISTGRTLVTAAHELKKRGADQIAAAATHGIFSPGAHELIEKSNLEKVYVTNTIAQESQGKVIVVDISAALYKIMQEYT